MTARLHAVTHPGTVTASAALAWFTSAGDRPVIGYLFAADRAEWFRCDAAMPSGPAGPRDLTTAYELVATDGERHLRWLHRTSGTGPAVSLSEHPELLPPGTPVIAGPARARLGGVSSRLLAGRVTGSADGWSTLGSARYARSQVPVAAQVDQEIWAEQAEYAVSDEHGNLSVVDTLLLRLIPRPAPKERQS
jgi:hypothetical protein